MIFGLLALYSQTLGILQTAEPDGIAAAKPSVVCLEFHQRVRRHVERGELANAERALSGAGALAGGLEPSCVWLMLHTQANILALTGRLAEAEVLAENALRILDRLYPTDDPIRFRTLQVLWALKLQRGKRGEARRTFQMMQSLRRVTPMDHAMFHSATATQLQTEGRHGEAEQEYLRAIGAWEESGHRETAEVAALLASLAELQTAQGRYPSARRALDRAWAIAISARDAVPMDKVNILLMRAALHARQKNWQTAEEDLRSAISLARLHAQMDPVESKRMLIDFADVLRKLHRTKEARSIEVQAAAIRVPDSAKAVVDVTKLSKKAEQAERTRRGLR